MSNTQLVELVREMEVFCTEKGFTWDVTGVANQVKERLSPTPSHVIFQDVAGKKELVRL